jgi:hypothetical protein
MGFGNGTDIHDLLPPYALPEHRPSAEGPPVIGQLVMTVVPEVRHPFSIFDAQRANQTTHASVSGTIRALDAVIDFRHKPNRLPVFQLKLGECEELLAVKAKARPCVVLGIAQGIPDQHLPSAERNIARAAFQRPAYLVAPTYSVSTEADPRAITTTIAARAECLVYPQLVFLPKSGGYISNDSVVRLDRAFWTTISPPSELYKLSISEERMAILQGQIRVLQGMDPGQDYLDLVALVRGELATEYERDLP